MYGGSVAFRSVHGDSTDTYVNEREAQSLLLTGHTLNGEDAMSVEDGVEWRRRMLNKHRLLQIGRREANQESDTPRIRLNACVVDGTCTIALGSVLKRRGRPQKHDDENS